MPDFLPGTTLLSSGVITAPEPLIWVLLPHAQALDHLSPVFLSEIAFILGPKTAGTRAIWPLSSLWRQHLPSLLPETTGADTKGGQ